MSRPIVAMVVLVRIDWAMSLRAEIENSKP